MNRKQEIAGAAAVVAVVVGRLLYANRWHEADLLAILEGVVVLAPTLVFLLRSRSDPAATGPAWMLASLALAVVLIAAENIAGQLPGEIRGTDMDGVERSIDGLGSAIRDLGLMLPHR